MDIKRSGSQPSGKGPAEYFTGTVRIDPFGRVDVMINNAGIMPRAPLERLTIVDWNRTIDINIKGVLYGIAAARPSLVYCGDDEGAKELAATLIRDVGFDPVDAGPLQIARYTEPFSLLIGQLAYEGDAGPELAYRFERFAE
jgi:hypothetical protein